MENDIFILNRHGGEYDGAYTIPLFYVTSKEEGERLAKLANEEFNDARERFPMPEDDRPDLTDNDWTDDKWDAYHSAREEKIEAVISARHACLTVDLDAPMDDYDDYVSYSVKGLSSREQYVPHSQRPRV